MCIATYMWVVVKVAVLFLVLSTTAPSILGPKKES